MDASALLGIIAQTLAKSGLEAVLIGNAAAALQGAPVTTLDFDFMFRASPANLKKLKRFADALDATILRPYYPVSALYRVVNEDRGLQVDFMPVVHGVDSFSSLRSRSHPQLFGAATLLVADLKDIIRSKRAANRPRDKAVLHILEHALQEKKNSRAAILKALKKESELALRDQIRRLLALPMEKRTHFLRVRCPGGGSHL